MYKTEIIKNVFSNEELIHLISLIEAHEPDPDQIVISSIGKGVPIGGAAIRFVNEKLPKLDNEQLSIKMLIANIPGGPHSDTYTENIEESKYFARTIIVPLYTCNTNTIIFNEKLPNLVEVGKYIDSLENVNSIDDETYEKYLTHMPREWTNKLTIDTIFPWIAGDILVFDRHKIHCSDNYEKNGLTNKRGLVIWTEINDN